MILCMELEIPAMIFEGDCLRVVKATNAIEESNGETSSIIHDIQALMQAHTAWHVQFVYREANHVAHTLAKKACPSVGEKIWMKDYPENVQNSVSHDKLSNAFVDWIEYLHSLLSKKNKQH